MPIDSSIAMSGRQFQMADPLEVQSKVASLGQLAGQQQLQQMQIQQAQKSWNQDQTLSDLYKGNINPDGSINRQALFTSAAQQGLGNRLPALQKQFLDTDKAAADVKHVGAQTNELDWKVAKGKIDASGAALSSLLANPNVTHDDVINTMVGLVKQGTVAPEQGQQAIQELPGDPVRLRQYLVQKGMEVTEAGKRMELLAPKFEKTNNGKVTSFADVNPYTNPQGPAPIQMTTTPGEDQSAATSRSNNAANLKKDYIVAGFNPDGSPAGDMETTAKAIASGQLPPPSGMALTNPRNQRMLSRVMEINPSYDFTDVTAKKKAASDFTTGALGNSMRSFAVAGQHLDQLNGLVDAMGNHDTQLVNKIANTYSQQTGAPAVTNFDAAKDVVSKEVVKAIVAGGGGVSEREELARLMANANSPAQLKGVINQYRTLMSAQHDALLQQRRAAGLNDSTLPAYTDASGQAAPQIPADIAAILKKHGGK